MTSPTYPPGDASADDDATQSQDGASTDNPNGDALSPEEVEARAAETRHKQLGAYLMSFHDRVHGPEQPLDDGIWAAVIQPRTQLEMNGPDNPLEPRMSIRCRITPVPGSKASFENPDNVWMTPSVAEKLGFPIKVARWPFQDWRTVDNYNYFIHSLFIGVDPSETSFAKYTHESWMGDALVVRTDGKDLSDQQIDGFLHYINDEFSVDALSILEMEEGEEKNEIKQKLATQYLNPAAFHAYFEEFRRKMIAEGRAWKETISPVVMTLDTIDPACGKCFKTEAVNGKFLICDCCAKRFYCSEKCKKQDQKKHLGICIKKNDEEPDGLNSECSRSDSGMSDFSKSDQSKSE